ncbi:MAG TPA: hypothetical protein VKK79_22285 [Candidatus Lokiarchaeia archaeon]|nr:hypothetical protein [Candidatus Lokiarchaeia archaeon]
MYQAPPPDTRPTVQQWDHVELNLYIWLETTYDNTSASVTPPPDLNITQQWYNFTTIYQNSSDTAPNVNTTGLPVGIYSGVNGGDGILGHHVGDSSPTPLYIPACSDLDKDGYDDYQTTRKALGWGFPDTNPFYNKTIIVTWAILNLTKVQQNTPNNKLGNNSTQSLQDGVPFRIVTREAYRAVLPDL